MTAPLKAIDGTADLPALMTDLAAQARAAARVLALAPPEQKDRALEAIERAIRANAQKILAANAEDVAEVRAGGATSAFIDRLTLTPARIDAMADGVATVRGIPDPVGTVTESWQRPNGMTIERVRVPLGVIGVIFESRPNVAADAGVLCLKSGNAVILRGGSDSFRSCRAIHDCLVQGLREAGLPEAAITLVPTRDRAAVGLLLTGLNGGVDVIVPRGGKSLVARVEAEARVPVFAHLEGVNHVYVDRSADLEMAKRIVLNAKMRRPGVCGAAETLLVDRAGAATNLKPLVEMLIDAGCEVRGDDAVQKIDSARESRPPTRTGTPNMRTPSSRRASSTASTRRSPTFRITARIIPMRSWPRTIMQPRNSSARSIRRSCCTTPRRSSPTAASSASARRSELPPANSTPAARSAPSN